MKKTCDYPNADCLFSADITALRVENAKLRTRVTELEKHLKQWRRVATRLYDLVEDNPDLMHTAETIMNEAPATDAPARGW